MKTFSPDELKQQYPGKYDKWNFVKNSKGDWIGSNGKITGHIITINDEKGCEIPDLQFHNLTSTGGFGLNIWSQSLNSATKKKIK